MNAKFLNPFIEAAFAVLEMEVGTTSNERGGLTLERSACTANDITVLITMVGQVQGIVLFGINEATALAIVTKILNQPFEEFDELAQSGISELGNVITGQASRRLAEAGYEAKISPPTLIIGKRTLISTLDFERLLVPIKTEFGELQIHLALLDRQTNSQVGQAILDEVVV